ncbi:MAG: aminoacyl-tRNA deacylase [Gemmataceae bacterium]
MSLVSYLDEQRVPFQTILHPPAFTAQRRAKYLRVSGHYVARAVLLHGPEGFFLAVLPATYRVDLPALTQFFGGPVRLAHRDETARHFRDCEWGVVSPFGNRYGLLTLIDSSVPTDTWIFLEGGTHVEAVLLHGSDFERLSGSFRFPFTRRDSA